MGGALSGAGFRVELVGHATQVGGNRCLSTDNVIGGEACPSMVCTPATDAPAEMASDAAVCRGSCGVRRSCWVSGFGGGELLRDDRLLQRVPVHAGPTEGEPKLRLLDPISGQVMGVQGPVDECAPADRAPGHGVILTITSVISCCRRQDLCCVARPPGADGLSNNQPCSSSGRLQVLPSTPHLRPPRRHPRHGLPL